jgi:hypothetical protein
MGRNSNESEDSDLEAAFLRPAESVRGSRESAAHCPDEIALNMAMEGCGKDTDVRMFSDCG